jgi:hypothetical protein
MSFIKKKDTLKDKVVQYLESLTVENKEDDEDDSGDDEDDDSGDDEDEDDSEDDEDDENDSGDDDDEDDDLVEDDEDDDEVEDDDDEDDDDEDDEEDDDYTSKEDSSYAENSVSEYNSDSDSVVLNRRPNKSTPEESDSDSEPILIKGDPTLFHMFTNEPYYHLPAYSSDIEIEGNDTIRVHICAYILCNNTYNDPYISFILEFLKKSNLHSFPSFLYTPLNNVNHHDFLKNKCLEILYPILNVSPENIKDNFTTTTENAFKGYIHHSGTKEIIVGINVEDFMTYQEYPVLTLSQSFRNKEAEHSITWAILDEILKNKSIDHHPIDPNIRSILESNKSIYKIFKSDDTLAEIPRMLYPCNSTLDSDDSLSFISKSKNDEHGRIYLFSENPRNDSEKRFVVFPTIHYSENDEEFFGVLSQDKFREF